MPIVDETYNFGAQFRVTAVGEFDNNADVLNVYEWFKTDATPQGGGFVISDLLVIMEALCELVAAVNNIRTVWKGIRIEELDGTNATGLLAFPGGNIAGELDTEAVPSGVAALLRFPTGVKRMQLRKFIGTLDESRTSPGGNLTATAQADLADIVAFLVSSQAGIGTWHYSYNRPGGGPIVMPLAGIVNAVPSYQRRRKFNTGS